MASGTFSSLIVVDSGIVLGINIDAMFLSFVPTQHQVPRIFPLNPIDLAGEKVANFEIHPG
ncbi:MAG: hypothetical protein AB4290_23800 [Spirulina sp.]